MATVRITTSGESWQAPLAADCLVGRAAECLLRVTDAAVPSFWLELRWFEGGWRWRALAGVERTRGPGMLTDDGWRMLPLSTEARPQRVRLDELVTIALIAGGPPAPFAIDLLTGQARRGESLGEVTESRADGTIRTFGTADAPGRALADGEVFLHAGRPWRMHLPDVLPPTLRLRLDLARTDASIDVDAEALRATFHQGGSHVTIAGEHVRVLVVYALARLEDADGGGGWLDADAVYARWRGMGGNPQSPVDRIGWDRGRCRSHLSREGVGGVDALFEIRRRHGVPEMRVGVRVE
jgi:hypothetical protein